MARRNPRGQGSTLARFRGHSGISTRELLPGSRCRASTTQCWGNRADPVAQGRNLKTKLSHYGTGGEVQMVDVSAKQVTTRTAKAHAFVKMKPKVVAAVRRLKNPKG